MSAANTTTTAAAARAHRLWNHGRRTIAGVAMRARTRASSAGVAGQSISSRRRVRRCSSWVASGTGALLDPPAQAGERPRQARLDSAFGDAQRSGGFFAAQLEQVAAGDHEAVLLAQLVDETQQPLDVLSRHCRRLGGWGRIPRAEALGHTQLELVAAARGTNAVAGLVGDDSQQPGPRLRSRAEG